MRYVGYVACMGKGVVHRFCSGNPKGKTQFERPRTILKQIFKKQDEGHGLDLSRSGQEHVGDYCKYSVPLGLMKCGEFVG